MKRSLAALLMGLTALISIPSVAEAQAIDSFPNGYDVSGAAGSSSVAIPVSHFPSATSNWRVVTKRPGVAGNEVNRTCTWGANGAPADQNGTFDCILTGLEAGDHFIEVTYQAVGTTVRRLDAVYGHTVGNTSAVPTTRPFQNDQTGTWSQSTLGVSNPEPELLEFSYGRWTSSNSALPTVAYYLENETSSFFTEDLDTARVENARFGPQEWLIVPVTEHGFAIPGLKFGNEINVPAVLRNYRTATSITDLTNAADYDPVLDAQILRLYRAYFNRVPDTGGAVYWLGIRRQGFSVIEIAGFMSGSQEFNNLYAGTNNNQYVGQVYGNVLGRTPDQEGFDYWLGLVDTGQLDRSGMVYWVTQGQEFINNNPFQPTVTFTPS